jgi:hypothetical protein
VDIVEESGVLELERVVLVMIPGLEWYSALVGMPFPLIPEAAAADGREKEGERVCRRCAEVAPGKIYVDSPPRSVSVVTCVTTSVAGQSDTPEGQEVSVAVRELNTGGTER